MSSAADTIDASLDQHRGGHERAFLVVHLGHEQRSRIVEVPDGAEISFGRARDAAVRIDHEKVSRIHARLVRRGSTILIEDLSSRNGVLINGLRIECQTRLHAGDEISIGPAMVVLGASTDLRRRAGIASAAVLEQRLTAEIDRARRYRRKVGLIMMRLSGEPAEVDAAIDRVAARLRLMDELAEYALDELAILVPECDREATLAIVQELEQEIRLGAAAVCAGWAAYPEDASHADSLLASARDALRHARLGTARELSAAPEPLEVGGEGEPLIIDPQMRRLHVLLARIAASSITVLVLGETGVGKELAAEAVHRGSSRSGGPLVKVNCASLPENLLESELFGHERGAFTGADRRKQGYFEAADGGTMFLDEVGEMPLSLQVKLLRVLESRTIIRVGGTVEIPVNVRLVAATNRDLERAVELGTFREDLFFRVSGFTVVVPPLRNRPSEILPLMSLFLRAFARQLGQAVPVLSQEACRALLSYPWPGNVRELRNAAERAVVLQTEGIVSLEDLPERVQDGRSFASAPTASPEKGDVEDGSIRSQVAELEQSALAAALQACGGNQTQAAKRLGITRRALIYKMQKYSLKAHAGTR
jgi:DNA-binding NtrC family response regulator